jgi:hypothetical protein
MILQYNYFRYLAYLRNKISFTMNDCKNMPLIDDRLKYHIHVVVNAIDTKQVLCCHQNIEASLE